MIRFSSALLLVSWLVSASFAGPTRVRSGQVDFSGGIEENLRIVGDLATTGTVSAGVLSVTGAAAIGGRIEAGDSTNDLTVTVGASAFKAWLGDATESAWKFDEINYSAWPVRTGDLKAGVLTMGLSPGTRLYQVTVHGVFTNNDTGNELRARVYKRNTAVPTSPLPLTAESAETGGTVGSFSITLTPDYVVEDGYVVVVRVEIKNTNDKKTLFFGVGLTLHETTY